MSSCRYVFGVFFAPDVLQNTACDVLPVECFSSQCRVRPSRCVCFSQGACMFNKCSALPRTPVAHRRGWRGWMATVQDPRWGAEVATQRTSSQAYGKASGCWTKVSRTDRPRSITAQHSQTMLPVWAGSVALFGCMYLARRKRPLHIRLVAQLHEWGVAVAC